MKEFELPFWLTCLSCMCTYIAIINSITIGSKVLQARFHFDEVQAGFFYTLPYTVSACASPFVGIFVDKFGFRMAVTLSGSALMIFAHVMSLLMPECN